MWQKEELNYTSHRRQYFLGETRFSFREKENESFGSIWEVIVQTVKNKLRVSRGKEAKEGDLQ